MPHTWIEAALNGPWSRKRQPGIPDTVDAIVTDGIACASSWRLHRPRACL